MPQKPAGPVRVIDPNAMDIHGLAKYLGVSWRTIQEWEAKKEAPPRMALPGRVRRWSPKDVDQWLQERREAATALEAVAQ